MASIKQVKDQVEDILLKRYGITGVGIGASQPSINVYVEGYGVDVPSEIGGVPVKKIVSGPISILSLLGQIQIPMATEGDRHARWRPLVCGISVAHPRVTSGTLGFLSGNQIVSNNHVMAASSTVEMPMANLGDPILQPGPYYGGYVPDDVVAELTSYVPLKQTGDNFVDVAMARPVGEVKASPEILGIGIPTGFGDINVGDYAVKSGATSSVTEGEVLDVNAAIKVSYGAFTLTFKDQIVTSPMAQGGDSGSALLNRNHNVVGLLFAGSSRLTIHNKIKYVKGVSPAVTDGLGIGTLAFAALGAGLVWLAIR